MRWMWMRLFYETICKRGQGLSGFQTLCVQITLDGKPDSYWGAPCHVSSYPLDDT